MSESVLFRATRVIGLLVVVAILLSFVPSIPTLATAPTSVGRGAHTTSIFQSFQDTIDFPSPAVSTDDVEAGAIIVAQIVARGESSASDVWICPKQAGWTEVARIAGINGVVQHIWWRPVITQQSASTEYAFRSSIGGCSPHNAAATSMAGGLTVFTGVDITDPIGAVVSMATASAVEIATAPATTSTHRAGSRVVRYFGNSNVFDVMPDDASRVYSLGSRNSTRTAAAFDALVAGDGSVGEFDGSIPGKMAAWVATTLVLEAPSVSTEPTDTAPPVTTATTTPYTPGTWTNAPVAINLSAEDPDGSGVKEIVYRAIGAQEVAQTTVSGAMANVLISAEGETTVYFAARDNAENLEPEREVVVKIDTTVPTLAGMSTTSPNVANWFNTSVTIGWTCSDALSGIAGGCPIASVIDVEGRDLAAEAIISDRAGNETAKRVSGINIDRTPPQTTVATDPSWSDEPATVSLLASDNLSGVAATYYQVNDGPQQTGNEVVISESGVHSVRYWSVDVAGNVEQAGIAEFKVDTLAPTITYSLSSPANEHGWHREPVTITFHCADSPSGIANCSEPQTIATDGANQSVTGTATDNAGNSATSTATVNLDQTEPQISASQLPVANAEGWSNASVIVSFTCNDELSGIANCPDAVTVGEGANQSVTGVTTDKAGNAASDALTGLNVDLTAPTISASAKTADGLPYVVGTWVNQPVTVTFECSDGLAGIATCPEPRVVGEGSAQSVTGTAIDRAGNSVSATIAGINVDLTAPTISASLTMADGASYAPGTWTAQPVTITFTCDDGLSGVASCSPQQTLGNGADQLVTGTVVDAAGNSMAIVVADVDVDLIGPSIIASATTADGAAYVPGTWTNQTVTVTFTCHDDGSGLAGACPQPVVIDASTPVEGRPVSAQVGDRAGLTASSPIILVKVDKDAPVFTSAPGDQVVEATSADGAAVSWSDPAASDAIAGDIVPVCSAASGSTFMLGATTVTCTATDPAGNVATAAFTVTVVDAPLPELSVPEPIVVPADSPAGAVVTYEIGAGEARVASLPECAPASGSRFRVGTTMVTCSASNATGQTVTDTFTVTVIGAAELLSTLRTDTVDLVKNPAHERALLRPLDQAQQAMKAGNPLAAYLSMLRYRVNVALYLRYRYVTPDVYRELQRGAEQVTNAMF